MTTGIRGSDNQVKDRDGLDERKRNDLFKVNPEQLLPENCPTWVERKVNEIVEPGSEASRSGGIEFEKLNVRWTQGENLGVPMRLAIVSFLCYVVVLPRADLEVLQARGCDARKLLVEWDDEIGAIRMENKAPQPVDVRGDEEEHIHEYWRFRHVVKIED
jgi:hypothetical protein